MSEWKEYTIGTAPIQIIDGDRSANYPKHNELHNIGDVPFLNSTAIKNFKLDYSEIQYLSLEKFHSIRKGKVESKDIVLTTRGNGVGKLILFENEPFQTAVINAQMLILRVKGEQLNSHFLYHFLKSKKIQDDLEAV